MQLMTKKAIKKLLSDIKHVLDVKDFDDIGELDKLADKIVSGSTEERRLLNQPFELCGIKFYPLTIAKSLWYAEKCEDWSLEGIFQDVFLFWLLTLPLTDEALETYSLRKDADKAVKRLSKKLHCTAGEMTDIFQRCVGSKASDSGDEPINYGSLIAVLLREYGGTADGWLYECPIEKIGSLIDQYVARINAENDASAAASASSGKAVAPSPTAKLEALKNFRLKVNAIKEKWVNNG